MRDKLPRQTGGVPKVQRRRPCWTGWWEVGPYGERWSEPRLATGSETVPASRHILGCPRGVTRKAPSAGRKLSTLRGWDLGAREVWTGAGRVDRSGPCGQERAVWPGASRQDRRRALFSRADRPPAPRRPLVRSVPPARGGGTWGAWRALVRAAPRYGVGNRPSFAPHPRVSARCDAQSALGGPKIVHASRVGPASPRSVD
jgi:hypothetical protein